MVKQTLNQTVYTKKSVLRNLQKLSLKISTPVRYFNNIFFHLKLLWPAYSPDSLPVEILRYNIELIQRRL